MCHKIKHYCQTIQKSNPPLYYGLLHFEIRKLMQHIFWLADSRASSHSEAMSGNDSTLSFFFLILAIKKFFRLFTRGQFWPSGNVIACVCLSMCPCVRPCVNPELFHAITCHTFKLESPNLHQKCKTPWLRSLSFWGFIDLEYQCPI